MASAAVQSSGRQQQNNARAAAAGGFSGTLLTSPEGAPGGTTAKQTLGSG